MQKRWRSGRKSIGKMVAPEYHLIITEGKETEPRYFEGIRAAVSREYRDRIQIMIHGEGKSTYSLLEKAIRLVENDPKPVRHAWIVFDKDSFPKDLFDRTVQKCAELNQGEPATTYHALWSNECFELWFILHFAYQQTGASRNQYCRMLDRYLAKEGDGQYTKTRDDMYMILKERSRVAIANAKRLQSANKGKAPSDANPGTMVYEFLEHLKPYL